MNDEKLKLWNEIKNFELDEPEISLSFTDRLARENGWSIEYSIRAILEYKKFHLVFDKMEFVITKKASIVSKLFYFMLYFLLPNGNLHREYSKFQHPRLVLNIFSI